MYRKTFTATIANGQSLSGAVDLEGMMPAWAVMPAAWTAAGLTFQGSFDGTNFFNLYDLTAEISATSAAASVAIQLNEIADLGLHSLKIRSGTAAVPVAQGAERVITLVMVDV